MTFNPDIRRVVHLCSRLLSTELAFYCQKSKIAFCATVWGLRGNVHLWSIWLL